MPRSIVALALAVALSGCSLVARNHRGLGVAADALAVSGYLVSRPTDCGGDGVCQFGAVFVDPMKMAIGLGLAVSAAIVGTVAVSLPPSQSDDSAITIDDVERRPPAPPPAAPAQRAPVDLARVDPLTLRLAKQAWHAARDGQCDATRTILGQISARAPAYRDQLALDPVIAVCVTQ